MMKVREESLYLNYQARNNMYEGWAMSQKLLLGRFKWFEETSKFNKGFIKNYDEHSDIGYFFEVDVLYPEELDEGYNNLSFLLGRKLKSFKKF